MRKLFFISAAALLPSLAFGQAPRPDEPQFTSNGEMRNPRGYREWVFLSSGLGMTYGPLGANADRENPMFDNVYVNPSAYRSFLANGSWPDKTVLVLEIRASQSKESINQGGHFQTGLVGIEVHAKDTRLPGGWAFYDFSGSREMAKPIPPSASCYSCHAEHGALDTTFVQFYPTLLGIAQSKHTIH